jgi:hypothetical protein
MIKKLLNWWHNLRDDTEIGRNGVRVRKSPGISHNGSMYWNVRDIIFKPENK